MNYSTEDQSNFFCSCGIDDVGFPLFLDIKQEIVILHLVELTRTLEVRTVVSTKQDMA